MAGVWVWVCAFSCVWQRETERSHKYVYLCPCTLTSLCVYASTSLRARCRVRLCVFAHVPNDEIQIKNIKARITFGCYLDDRKILAWQWYAFYAVTLMVNKKKNPSLSCSHFLTDKNPTLFFTSSLAKTPLFPTNAGVTNKISSEFSILVSSPNQGYLYSRVYFCRYQVLRGKLTLLTQLN